MKKYFFFYLIAAIALCSCVKDEPDGVWGDEKITFDVPVVSTMTKAKVLGEISPGYNTGENFSVYAVYTDNAITVDEIVAGTPSTSNPPYLYMKNVETQYVSDANFTGWDPAAVTNGKSYYWPKHGYLTFAAYSPSSFKDDDNDPATTTPEISWDINNGFKLTNFTVADASNNQYDLMFSSLAMNHQKTSDNNTTNNTTGGVDIVFSHALSSIKFKMENSYESNGTTIEIKKITIKGAHNTGNFAQTLSKNTGNGSLDISLGWSGQSGNVNYLVYDKDVANKIALPGSATEYYLNNYDAILLPQLLNDGTHNVTAEVEYNMKSPTGVAIPQKQTVSLATTSVDKWEPGFRYIYTINFALNKIYFTPSVSPWVDTPVTGPTV